jgi:rRNA pseudouridine-1189 N-methylase Emg1 (Nep1/Mra1 family)
MQIAINNLLKTFKIRIRNKNIIIKFKKKNLNNLIKRKDFFKKTLRKIKSIASFYYYKF